MPVAVTRSPILTSIVLGLFAFAAFALLPQRTLHGTDSDLYSTFVQAGEVRRAPHVAFYWICRCVLDMVAGFGLGAVQAMWLTSAFGSAVGVFSSHRAALEWVDASRAAIVAVGVAVTPAVFYYATTVEIHGVFAAGVGVTWWMFARFARSPDRPRALLLGAVSGVAATIHSFGHLLPALVLLAAVLLRIMPWRRLVATAVLVGVGHGVSTTAVAALLGHGPLEQFGAAGGMVGSWSSVAQVSLMPETTWREAVVPFLPWSVLVPCVLCARRAVPWSLVFLLGMALHLPLVLALLAREGVDERGGYLLPMVLPGALAVVMALPKAVSCLAAAIGLAVSTSVVAPRWQPCFRADFVPAISSLLREQPCSLIVGATEIEAVRTYYEQNFRGVFCIEVKRALAPILSVVSPRSAVTLAQAFDATFDSMGGSTKTWFVTEEAIRAFRSHESPSVRELWDLHIPITYECSDLHRPALHGVLLRHHR